MNWKKCEWIVINNKIWKYQMNFEKQMKRFQLKKMTYHWISFQTKSIRNWNLCQNHEPIHIKIKLIEYDMILFIFSSFSFTVFIWWKKNFNKIIWIKFITCSNLQLINHKLWMTMTWIFKTSHDEKKH